MAKALTVKAIENLKPGAGRREIPDGEVRGLYLTIFLGGKRSWILRYRFEGRTRKLTIGPWPEIGSKDARNLARKAHVQIAGGNDPGTEKRTAKLAKRVSVDHDLVEKVVAQFLSRHVKALAPALPVLRFHPRCPHPSGANLPAMIGLVEHVDHGPTAIHRTFISADGFGKATVEPNKASLGPVAGGAVRLAQVRAGQWLLVAEGLETTLSVMHACALPGWAALSAGGIKSLVLPPSANMVVICADNDANGVGQRASLSAAERFLAEGRRVRIALPPTSGLDFNDLLRGSPTAHVDECPNVT